MLGQVLWWDNFFLKAGSGGRLSGGEERLPGGCQTPAGILPPLYAGGVWAFAQSSWGGVPVF